jgi:hypothetical protein
MGDSPLADLYAHMRMWWAQRRAPRFALRAAHWLGLAEALGLDEATAFKAAFAVFACDQSKERELRANFG